MTFTYNMVSQFLERLLWFTWKIILNKFGFFSWLKQLWFLSEFAGLAKNAYPLTIFTWLEESLKKHWQKWLLQNQIRVFCLPDCTIRKNKVVSLLWGMIISPFIIYLYRKNNKEVGSKNSSFQEWLTEGEKLYSSNEKFEQRLEFLRLGLFLKIN